MPDHFFYLKSHNFAVDDVLHYYVSSFWISALSSVGGISFERNNELDHVICIDITRSCFQIIPAIKKHFLKENITHD